MTTTPLIGTRIDRYERWPDEHRAVSAERPAPYARAQRAKRLLHAGAARLAAKKLASWRFDEPASAAAS